MWKEIPELYNVARKICYEFGLPWTDPRTGVTHQPPKPRRPLKRLKTTVKKAPRGAK